MSTFLLEAKDLEILGLRPILNEIVMFVHNTFSLKRMTGLWRPDGYASMARHFDFECRNHVVGHHIEEEVNRRWVYDPERPLMNVAWWHDSGQGPHLHTQVHDNTVRIL